MNRSVLCKLWGLRRDTTAVLLGEGLAGRMYLALHAAFQKPKMGKNWEVVACGISNDKSYGGEKQTSLAARDN